MRSGNLRFPSIDFRTSGIDMAVAVNLDRDVPVFPRVEGKL